jgi:hypothetical protein
MKETSTVKNICVYYRTETELILLCAFPFSCDHRDYVVSLPARLYLASREITHSCHVIRSPAYCFN